jgi:3-phytase
LGESRQSFRQLDSGTNKVAAPGGALVVFGLDGKIRQSVTGIDRPNNVDIEYGLGGLDIAAVTERRQNRLRFFAIDEKGVRQIGLVDCFPEPMGVGLYKRPRDGVVFAIVAPKGRPDSPRENYLADPDRPQAAKELAMFAQQGYRGDREGLAIYAKEDGSGYLISTDQLPANTDYHVFDRKTNQELFVFRGGADTTDGIDITSANLGPEFPAGLFVAMNSSGKNFLLYDARRIVRR